MAYLIAVVLLLATIVSAATGSSSTTQYATGSHGQPLYVDTYPAGERAVVMVHGGQWTGGARNENRPVQSCKALQARGVTCYSIDYELAPASQWPAQLQNLRDALTWVQARGHENVSVWGHSSGAHLALMLAFTTAGVDSVVGWSSPTDFTAGWGRRHAINLLGCAPAVCPERALEASPIHHAHAGAPRILLAHSVSDGSVPYAQSSALAARLAALGAPHRLDTYPGSKHGGALYAQAFEASYAWIG